MQRNTVLLLLMCILFGVFATILARGEDVGPDTHPVVSEVGFSIGEYSFLFFPAMDQPLPHISGGFADYQGEQSLFHLPDFYLGTCVLREKDLPEARKAAGTNLRSVRQDLQMSDHDIIMLLREMDRHYKPTLDGKEVDGYYAIPTAAMMVRALFDGESMDVSKWDSIALGKRPVFMGPFMEMFADRFSTDLNWAGEAQPGELSPTCETGRWVHLFMAGSLCPWPDKNRKDEYLNGFAFGNRKDRVFQYGQPTRLYRLAALVRLAFVPLP